jgi:hypothetical protein
MTSLKARITERRRFIRTPRSLPVRIFAAGLKQAVFGTVRDISEAGARIAVERPTALPDLIELKSPLERDGCRGVAPRKSG